MAIDMFLYIEGVDGDSKDAQHKGWIDVLAWSFGMSNSVSSGQVPAKARARKAAEKKKLLAEAGFDEHENPLEGHETEKLSRQEQQLKIEEALMNYDPDEGLEFDDSEIVPQKGRANMQDISLTKYMGLSTAQLFAMCFNQKKGVKAILRCCKGAGYNAPPRDPSKPHVVMQEITLHDCFVSSISTGGSGGEDRLTENITLTFRSLEFKINDTRAKDPLAPPEDPTKKKKTNRYGEEEEDEEEEKPTEDGAPAKPKFVSNFVPPTATVALDSLRKTAKLEKKEGYQAAPSSASASSASASSEESKMQD